MLKKLGYILELAVFIYAGYYSYKYLGWLNISSTSNIAKFGTLTFFLGLSLAFIIANIGIFRLEKQLKAYKRQLEKESIGSTESSSRVEVLESKIKVLEKALDEAIKK